MTTAWIKQVKDVPQVRRLIISGFIGSGKTTLSVSASDAAGPTLPAKVPVECNDTVLLQGDSEGVYGAIDCGLTPLLVDFTDVENWNVYYDRLTKVVKEIAENKDIKYVIVDLALPNRLIHDHVKPAQINDWNRVSVEGLKLYRAFAPLAGKTVIANVHVKALQGAVESDVAKAASEARAMGGERATFGLDLYKGVCTPWAENASMILAREVKKVKSKPTEKDSPMTREFWTHTSASARLEVKSRFASKIAAKIDGSLTLNSILKTAYGDNA